MAIAMLVGVIVGRGQPAVYRSLIDVEITKYGGNHSMRVRNTTKPGDEGLLGATASRISAALVQMRHELLQRQ